MHAEAPAPEEIHLSHNYLKPCGVKCLLTAAAASVHYPTRSRRPLWLRVERQCVPWKGFVPGADAENQARVEEMLRWANRWMSHARDAVCLPRVSYMLCQAWKGECTANSCKWSHWAHGAWSCPLVHVPYMWNQSANDGCEPPEALLSLQDGWENWKPCDDTGVAQSMVHNASVAATRETSGAVGVGREAVSGPDEAGTGDGIVNVDRVEKLGQPQAESLKETRGSQDSSQEEQQTKLPNLTSENLSAEHSSRGQLSWLPQGGSPAPTHKSKSNKMPRAVSTGLHPNCAPVDADKRVCVSDEPITIVSAEAMRIA